MIPRLKVRYSYVYNKTLNKDIDIEMFNKLREKSIQFNELVEKYGNKVLKLIEKENEKWKDLEIPIYIVMARIKSFSDPLTINSRKNKKTMLLVLRHELIHVNTRKKFKVASAVHDFVVTPIFNKVIEQLNLKDFEEAFEEYYQFNKK